MNSLDTNPSSIMNKVAISIITILLVSIPCQANTDLPDIKMHVFDNNVIATDNPSAMQMVIFSSDETSEKLAESKEQNFRLAYTDDGEVSVYSEDNRTDAFVDEDEQEMNIEFYADVGYRQDKLDWTIAAPDGSPNILSELTWDNIETVTFGLGTTLRTSSNWVANADFVYGQIIDGNNQDSDFLGDNKTIEFSRSNNNADEGNVLDLSISTGYQFDFWRIKNNKPIVSLTPLVGFSYHAQNLSMTNGVQTISLIPGFTPPLGNFDAVLDTEYEAIWYGPWAGVNSHINLGPYVSLFGSFEYHYAFYEATADWNLRTDFAHPESFTHEAEGTGINASIASRIQLNPDFSLNLSIDYKKWQADKKGIDTTFFSDGSSGETGLNEVNWKSMGANIGLSYAF